MSFPQIENVIGYSFINHALLRQALTMESQNSYEQLEFLGASILNFVITDQIVKSQSKSGRLELEKTRHNIANKSNLLKVSKERIGWESLRLFSKDVLLESPEKISEFFEAVVGAIYKDGGIDCARSFILKFALPQFQEPLDS